MVLKVKIGLHGYLKVHLDLISVKTLALYITIKVKTTGVLSKTTFAELFK